MKKGLSAHQRSSIPFFTRAAGDACPKVFCALVTACLPANRADDQQQNHCANKGNNDAAKNAHAYANAKGAEQPAADDAAENTDDDRANQTYANPFDNRIRQQTSDAANNDPEQNTSEIHIYPPNKMFDYVQNGYTPCGPEKRLPGNRS
jgi:hypothetical protein